MTRTFVALGVTLVAVLTACRPCPRVDDAWQFALRDELAHVGAGVQVDSGVGDHARLTLSEGAFRYATAPLSEVEVFRPASEQVAFTFNEEIRAVLDGEILLRLTGVSLAPVQEQQVATVEITLQSVVSFSFDHPTQSARFTTTGSSASLMAPLVFFDDEQSPTLAIDLSRAEISNIGFDAAELPTSFQDVPASLVMSLMRSLLDEALSAAPQRLSVIRFGPIELGWTDLRVAASSIAADPGGAWIALGVVTNLRPEDVLPDVTPPADGHDAYFRYQLEPDLWFSALRYLQVVGRMPRRFRDGVAEVDGPVAVAIERATLSAEGASLRMAPYQTRGMCGVESQTAEGPVAVTGDGVAVGLIPTGGPAVNPGHVPAIVSASRDTARALLNPTPLRLQAARRMRLEPSALQHGGTTIIEGSVVLEDAEFR